MVPKRLGFRVYGFGLGFCKGIREVIISVYITRIYGALGFCEGAKKEPEGFVARVEGVPGFEFWWGFKGFGSRFP